VSDELLRGIAWREHGATGPRCKNTHHSTNVPANAVATNANALRSDAISEVVFSRFKKYGRLNQIMQRNYFHYVHYLWAWAHGMSNTYFDLFHAYFNDAVPLKLNVAGPVIYTLLFDSRHSMNKSPPGNVTLTLSLCIFEVT
jgi:hypothetical protein